MISKKGLGPINGAVDFALLLSGRITPVFNVKGQNKKGEEETKNIDLSSVFQVDADLYHYVNGDWISVQLAVSRNLFLTELCEIEGFEVFCDIFDQADLSFIVRAFANNNGFGLQFAFDATIAFKPGFDIIEDLVGWPADNQVSASLDLKLLNGKFFACVEFEGTQFCTGKCSSDADCEDDQACDNVFKVCREKRGNGGKCGRDAGCKSGHCVSGKLSLDANRLINA